MLPNITLRSVVQLLANLTVDRLAKKIEMPTVPGGFLDHVSQRVPEGERHIRASSPILERGVQHD